MIKVKNIVKHYAQIDKNEITKIYNAFDEVNSKDTVRDLGFFEPNLLKVISELSSHFPNVSIKLDGGYEGAEKKKVVLYPGYFGDVEVAITFMKIKYSKKFYKLSHPEVLGTLANCGIDYNKFGDILVSNGDVEFIVDEMVSDNLEFFVERIAKQKVKIEKIKEITIKVELNPEKTIRVSSCRIDVVIKNILNLSRTKSQDLITNKLVKLNFSNQLDNTKNVSKNDIISIRGRGRFTIIDISPASKGKYNVIYR